MMYKVLELLGTNWENGGDPHLHTETFKTPKEAAAFIKKDLDDMEVQLEHDRRKGERKWAWGKYEHNLKCSLPWWTDGSMMVMTVKMPDAKKK